MANLFAACITLTAVIVAYIMSRARPVYLLDFHVFKPRDDLKMPSAVFLQHSRKCKVAQGLADVLALLQGWRRSSGMTLKRVKLLTLQGFTPESITFQEKMVAKGGLGDETYLPDGTHASLARLLHSVLTFCTQEYTFTHCCTFTGNQHACINARTIAVTEEHAACGRAAVHADPPCPTMANARAEAEMVMFGSVRQVLATCGVSALQVR